MYVRLAKMFRKPVYELMQDMPHKEFTLWAAVLSRDPPVEERIEILLASLAAMLHNQRAGRKGSKKKTEDFLFFRNVWKFVPKSSGNADVDSDIKMLMEAFAPILQIRQSGAQ